MADRTFQNQKNINSALKLLKVVIAALDKHHVKYYLDFGTLIGAMRDNAFIPWDDDIDISLIDEKDYKKIPKILEEIKKEYGYRTYLHTFKQSIEKHLKNNKIASAPKINFTDENNYQISKIRNNKFWFFGRGNVCIDIFFKYRFKEESYWLAYGKTNKSSIDILKEGTMQIDFYGISCSIPVSYDLYLESMYGEWKIPDKEWIEEN